MSKTKKNTVTQAQHPEQESQAEVLFHSAAEKIVYEHLQATLPKGSLLMHSVQISHVPEQWGLVEREIDFVVFHPSFGLFVIEVKGGQIGFDAKTSRFTSRDRGGRVHRIKDPFKQVHSVKTILLKMLRMEDIRTPVSAVVVTPDTDLDQMDLPPFCNPKLVLGSKQVANIKSGLEEVFRVSHPEKFRQVRSSFKEVESFFRGSSFATKSYLGDFIQTQEAKVQDIEHLYQSFLEPLIAQKRVAIEGDAGTGKSFLAFTLAQKMQQQGKNTILLTSNKQLAADWRKELSAKPQNSESGEPLGKVKVATYIGLAENYGIHPLDKPDYFEGSKEDWLQLEAPSRWLQALSTEASPYDVLICDEAQDVQPYWWEPLCTLVKEENSLFLFFDRKQGIFGSGSKTKSFEPEQVLPVPSPYFPLIHNYRSTDQIVKYAQALYPTKDNLLSHSQREGLIPECIVYKDSSAAADQLKARIKQLSEHENIASSDIFVLSALRIDHPNSILKGVKLDPRVTLSTVAAFKGLEAKVAILVNFSEHKMPVTNPLMRNLLYVANTRAKHHLISFFREGDDKSLAVKAAIATLEPALNLVVDKNTSDVQAAKVIEVHATRPLCIASVEGKKIMVVLSSSQHTSLKTSKGATIQVALDSLGGLALAEMVEESIS